jgi:hypothetical protein
VTFEDSSGNYVLEGRTPVRERDVIKWAEWYERSRRDGSRIVGNFKHNGIKVSTVFLGIDHSFGDGPPLLFETMIFGGEDDQTCWRFSTWEEAEAHHMATCRELRAKHPSST